MSRAALRSVADVLKALFVACLIAGFVHLAERVATGLQAAQWENPQ